MWWGLRKRESYSGKNAIVFVDPITEQRLLSASNSGSVNTGIAGSGESSSNASKSMIGGDFDLGKLSESIINKMADYLEKVFEPVQLSFSIEVLSQQIHNISILFWILTVCLSIFFFFFFFFITFI